MPVHTQNLAHWAALTQEIDSLSKPRSTLRANSAHENRRDGQEQLIQQTKIEELTDDCGTPLAENHLHASGAKHMYDTAEVEFPFASDLEDRRGERPAPLQLPSAVGCGEDHCPL